MGHEIIAFLDGQNISTKDQVLCARAANKYKTGLLFFLGVVMLFP